VITAGYAKAILRGERMEYLAREWQLTPAGEELLAERMMRAAA
jgi:hypothetical protein